MNATDGLSSVKEREQCTLSFFFSFLLIGLSMPFILYVIYPFLKCGALYVNSATGSFYIGDVNDAPAEVVIVSNGSINIDNIGNVQSFFGMNLDQILQKMKDAGIGTGGGSSGGSGTGGGSEPGSGNSTITLDFPDKSELTVGNTVAFANKDWIVVHVTDTEAYLALSTVASNTPIAWAQLQQACIDWANEFLKAENRAYLKSVRVETTCGIVFAASEEQLNGGFSYFNSNSKRKVGTAYWSSSGSKGFYAYWVDEDGVLDNGSYGSDNSHEECFRPFICIDLTMYNT